MYNDGTCGSPNCGNCKICGYVKWVLWRFQIVDRRKKKSRKILDSLDYGEVGVLILGKNVCSGRSCESFLILFFKK